jgi:hypothetical protein
MTPYLPPGIAISYRVFTKADNFCRLLFVVTQYVYFATFLNKPSVNVFSVSAVICKTAKSHELQLHLVR